MKRTTIITAAFAAALTAGVVGAAAAAGAGPFADDDTALTGEALDRASEAALAEVGSGEVTDAEADDGGYEVEVRTDDGREIDVRLDGDFAVVGQEPDESDDSDDQPLTGEALDRASEAALAEVGSGEVTDAEADDGGYEVEVRTDDGREIDVHLDGDFSVVSTDDD